VSLKLAKKRIKATKSRYVTHCSFLRIVVCVREFCGRHLNSSESSAEKFASTLRITPSTKTTNQSMTRCRVDLPFVNWHNKNSEFAALFERGCTCEDVALANREVLSPKDHP
jgi:hypothetical protein